MKTATAMQGASLSSEGRCATSSTSGRKARARRRKRRDDDREQAAGLEKRCQSLAGAEDAMVQDAIWGPRRSAVYR